MYISSSREEKNILFFFFLIPEPLCLLPIPHTNNLLHALTSTNRKLPLFINW